MTTKQDFPQYTPIQNPRSTTVLREFASEKAIEDVKKNEENKYNEKLEQQKKTFMNWIIAFVVIILVLLIILIVMIVLWIQKDDSEKGFDKAKNNILQNVEDM